MNNSNLLSKISQKEAATVQEMIPKYDAVGINHDQISVYTAPTITRAGKKTEHSYIISRSNGSCTCYNYKEEHKGSTRGCKHLNFVWFILGYVFGDLDLLETKSRIPIR